MYSIFLGQKTENLNISLHIDRFLKDAYFFKKYAPNMSLFFSFCTSMNIFTKYKKEEKIGKKKILGLPRGHKW